MNPEEIVNRIIHLWPNRKTKIGLGLLFVVLVLVWLQYILPKYSTDFAAFRLYSFLLVVLFVLSFIIWLFHSGRVIGWGHPFTVVFCLKASDPMATINLQNSMKFLNQELDKLGLLSKIRIKEIGSDIISNQKQAVAYREKFDVGLILWGEIFTGGKNGEKNVTDFKRVLFTCKVPGNLKHKNVFNLFINDVGIVISNRDWNVYEINSLPDTEKISENLSEIILFTLGLVYAQYRDYAEDSGEILESLFNLLEIKTKDEKVILNSPHNPTQIKLTTNLLRKGRLHYLLLGLYKYLGVYFVDNHNYEKGLGYLNRCISYRHRDVDILSSAAFASFHLNQIENAHKYTEQINEIAKNNQIYILNKAFFGILNKNYSSALHFYKEIVRRGREVDNAVIVKVIAFLDERKSENPKELAYDFGIGILNKYYCQEKIGNKELRRFMKTAKNKDQYREMVAYLKNDLFCRKRN